ncbi:transposase [Escherichia fergusonii]|uniref:transposase n=1 Tax=Escherichia fergusonii TaxID=564 RepID=UPI0015F6CD92|nr:transposase [Escherichia fergusonii]MBA5616990.1 transposase [Escherichia fergusonii]MBA5665562.1 transposase [Escherichia fergusonii]MBA8159917.1 transposase [Escherichia fergusonii]MBA8173458.1 transposase [Escherichia fergusonii]MBA8186730.1 transposase [Escherichia fergusonii]
MTNDLFINGRKIDSFGDWSPQTEHPAITIQRKEHDERIKLEQSLKMSPKTTIFVYPEPQEMPDVCKTEALFELEREYYPRLKEQRIRLDIAYDAVKNFEETSKPSEYDIAYEIKSNPFIYYEGNFNDGFGTAIEDVPKVLQSIPEGFRLIDVRQALRGSGQFILMTNKTDEEILQLAEANLTKHYSDKLNKLKQKLRKELDSMKELVSEYETQKKIAMQADIEQLTKISQKYSKLL